MRGQISLTRAQCFPQCPHQTISCPEDTRTSCSGPFSGPASTLPVLSRTVLSNSVTPSTGTPGCCTGLDGLSAWYQTGISANPHEAPGHTYPCPFLCVPFLTTLSGFLCSHSLFTIPRVFPGTAEWEPPNADCKIVHQEPAPVPGAASCARWLSSLHTASPGSWRSPLGYI